MSEDMLDAVAFEKSEAKILETLGLAKDSEDDTTAAGDVANIDEDFDDLEVDEIG